MDDCHYSKNYCNIIAVDLSNADPKSIQQINFTGNIDRDRNTIMFFINEEAKKEPI